MAVWAASQDRINIYDYQKFKLREMMIQHATLQAKFLETLHPEQQLMLHMPAKVLERDYTVQDLPDSSREDEPSKQQESFEGSLGEESLEEPISELEEDFIYEREEGIPSDDEY